MTPFDFQHAEELLQNELLRICGMKPSYAAMLRAAGVETLRDLRASDPGRLADGILATRPSHEAACLLPSAAVIEGWIRQAERLDPLVGDTGSGQDA